MTLRIYPRASAASDRLQVWVGVDDVIAPPALTWTLDGAPADPTVVRPLMSARPPALLSGNPPRTFTGIFEFAAVPGKTYRVAVQAGGEQDAAVMRAVPAEVPGGLAELRIMLVSCYHRANDRARAALQIKEIAKAQAVDLILFLGDQVYLDLPPIVNFQEDKFWLANHFERQEYAPNWFGAWEGAFRVAPAVFIPDDHEYWNNFPHAAPHIQNTWTTPGQAHWKDAADAMWLAFQQPGGLGPGDAFRRDISPLSILALDTRTDRQKDESRCMTAAAAAALHKWADDVIDNRWLGVLATGQSIFEERVPGIGSRIKDGHLANHADYRLLSEALRRITDARLPVLCLTGDVHWGRLLFTKRLDLAPALVEVISSPVSLLSAGFLDAPRRWWARLRGNLDETWPLFGEAPEDRDARYPKTSFPGHTFERQYPNKGNQVVMLSFAAITKRTVNVKTTFYPIHPEKKLPAHAIEFPLQL
jgi:hypothetical protein